MSEVNVAGIEEILRKLGTLDDRVKRKIQGGALLKALEPIRAAASRRARRRTGELVASLQTTPIRSARGVIRAGVKATAKHAHLMEFGWWWTTHSGRRVKRVGPYPAGGFLRPALFENGDKAREIFASEVSSAISGVGK